MRAKAHWAWAWAENIGAVLRTDKVSASPGQPRQSRGGNGFFNSPRLRKYLVASFALLARSSVNPVALGGWAKTATSSVVVTVLQ